jgi:hypothetical protein
VISTSLPIASANVSDGTGGTREARYWRRRPLPVPEAMAALATHVVTPRDRLDLITAQYLGDQLAFYRIADANPTLDRTPTSVLTPTAQSW